MLEISDNFIDSISLLRKEKRRRNELEFNSDEILENDLWTFLFDVGFTSLNINRGCNIKFGRDKNSLHKKNVDVMAECKDIRIYAECSIQQNISQKLSSWIADVELLRGYDIKEKNISYLFYTDQELSNQDRKKITDKGLKFVTPKILDYFRELIKCYKNLAFYQFLGYLLAGKLIKTFSKEDLTIPAIRGKYTNKEYCYIFGIQPWKLIPLATVLHRKINFEGVLPSSYQRLVKKKKINEIKKFISESRGVFPTNIVISFESKSKFFKPKGPAINDISFGELELPRKYQSVTVIDGQHRLFAYDNLEAAKTDLIYVIGFGKMALDDQIKTFVNINEKQTKVSSSLMWDLYTSILDRSSLDFRISSIAKNLNEKDNNAALYHVISYDSAPYSNISSKITLESFCTALRTFDIIDKFEGLFKIYDIDDKDDFLIIFILKSYFNAIRGINQEHWDRKEKSRNLLRSNQAAGAFIRLFKEIVIYLFKKDKIQNFLNQKDFTTLTQEFINILIPINKIVDELKTSDQIKKFKRVGEGGKREMFIDFVKEINTIYTDFASELLEDLKSEYIDERIKLLHEGGELNNLEVKESFLVNSRRNHEPNAPFPNDEDAILGIIKTVVAFANYKGGELIIGLKDRTWEVVGIDHTDLKYKNNWESYRSSIVNKIMDLTEGLVKAPIVERYSHNQKSLAVIKVNPISRKRLEDRDLVFLKKDGKIYKRDNDSSIPIKPNEIGKYCDEVLKEITDTQLEIEEIALEE